MNLFFELLQVSVGTRDQLSKIPTDGDWSRLYEESVRQSLVGIVFAGIEKLYRKNAAIRPQTPLFYQWLGRVLQIEQRNKALDLAASQLSDQFKHRGLRGCVLKGQGLARLYPAPLRRQPGDIDLWIEGSRESTLRFLKENSFGIDSVVIHHTAARIIDGVETEIHFMPIWMYNPIHNYRLQKYFRTHRDGQFSHFDENIGFCYPTTAFNGVYVLIHIFHHLMDEGVGLRQVIDYYYVLKQLSDVEQRETYQTVCKIGCRKFAAALMYVLGEVCDLDSSQMLCPPNVSKGKRLLSEIMQTGNFGQYDVRFDKSGPETAYARNKRKSERWVQLAKDYPSEVLCILGWKLWHWCWRKWNRYL